ncbi:MAG: vWA domain-containing protein [Caldilineaceae bacterium]
MRKFAAGLVLALGIVCALVYTWTNVGFAAPTAQVDTPTGPVTEPIDVVVVLDDSGSMATCWPWPEQGLPFEPPCRFPSENEPSDPDELRYSAARLLIHLADDADRVAVLRFDSSAEGVGALGALQEAGSAERRRILAASLQPPTNYFPRGYTRIDLGLEEARRLLSTDRQANRSQYVLLLTDGEPTAPAAAAGQRGRISALIDQLQAEDVLIFPVVLCNPTSGCAGDFLAEEFGPDLREAQSAADLLRVFSEIFAAMKADRTVVNARNTEGNLAFQTRDAHGVEQLAFVSPRGAVQSVVREGAPVVTQSVLDDGNIDLNVVEGNVPAGAWIAQTADPSAFTVVKASSYPELVFPPPSVPGSPASPRYFPAGSSPLIVARGAGDAAAEPILLDGQTAMPRLSGSSALSAMSLPANKRSLTLQLGEDRSPLQLRREFTLTPREDLPRAQIFSPAPGNSAVLEDEARPCAGGLRAGRTGAVGTGQRLHQRRHRRRHRYAGLPGRDELCGSSLHRRGLHPADGRSYALRFLLSAVSQDIRFGDWAETSLDIEPAVYLRGLPANLDLAQMPAEGWPITVLAGTTEEIGTLDAKLTLRSVDAGEVVPAATVSFSVDVDETNAQPATLRVDGLDELRPGDYEGEIVLSTTNPAGRPMDVKIRPSPTLPVTLSVPRSVARLQSQEADFGELPFETSPNFRIDRTTQVQFAYEQGRPFRLSAQLTDSSCPNLSVTTGEVEAQGDGYVLPLRLQSSGSVPPGACTGTIQFSGPNGDFDVFPAVLSYRLRVRNLEWSVTGSLNFGDLGLAGEQATQPLLVRFDGSTPFTVRVLSTNIGGETETGPVALDSSYLSIPPVEVTGEPDANGFYEVPITLAAGKAIPHDQLRGSFYAGTLTLGIEGLPNQTRNVDVGFRSPTAFQRYVAWWLLPIYSLPWLLCSGPLTLLLLLIIVARVRGGGSYADDYEEPVVTLPTFEPAPSANSFGSATFESSPPAAGTGDTSWGGGDWGNVDWNSGGGEANDQAPKPSSAQDDPWATRW